MSNRERYIELGYKLGEEQLVFVIDMIDAYLAAEEKRRKSAEDERDLKIAYEILERIEKGEEELITIDEYAGKRGLKLNGDD